MQMGSGGMPLPFGLKAVAEALCKAGAELGPVEDMILRAVLFDLDGSHQGSNPGSTFQVHALFQSKQQSGAVGISATRRVNDPLWFGCGDLQRLALVQYQ